MFEKQLETMKQIAALYVSGDRIGWYYDVFAHIVNGEGEHVLDFIDGNPPLCRIDDTYVDNGVYYYTDIAIKGHPLNYNATVDGITDINFDVYFSNADGADTVYTFIIKPDGTYTQVDHDGPEGTDSHDYMVSLLELSNGYLDPTGFHAFRDK